MNIPPYGNNYIKLNAYFEQLKVYAQDIPNKTVKVNPGLFWMNNELVEFPGGVSSNILSPINPKTAKIIVITINNQKINIIHGQESSNPEIPIIPENNLPLALIYLQYGNLVITNDMIFDLRPFINIYKNYPELNNITIDKISNLNDILNKKLNIETFETVLNTIHNKLNLKADLSGTNEYEFSLNNYFTGVPSTDSFFSVNRGSLPKVSIKWNESIDEWEYTDDGINWKKFNNNLDYSVAKIDTLGLVKLSTKATIDSDPIVVSDNDLRLLTIKQKDDLLNHLNEEDPHHIFDQLKLKKEIINYEHFNLETKCKLCKTDENKVITGKYTFNTNEKDIPAFNIGINNFNVLIPGLNSDRLNGKKAEDFVSSKNATNQIFLIDKENNIDKYKLEVSNGNLILTKV